MSNRTLIELNHDHAEDLGSPEFAAALKYYLRSASKPEAKALERFGARVIGLRHHSDKFILDGEPDGFPPLYLGQSS